MAKIAYLGGGNMAQAMGTRLIAAGHDLTVYNRTATKLAPLVAKGAKAAASPREAVQGADVVFCSVTDDTASRAMWMGLDGALAGGLPAGTLVVEHSTMSPRLGEGALLRRQGEGPSLCRLPGRRAAGRSGGGQARRLRRRRRRRRPRGGDALHLLDQPQDLPPRPGRHRHRLQAHLQPAGRRADRRARRGARRRRGRRHRHRDRRHPPSPTATPAARTSSSTAPIWRRTSTRTRRASPPTAA